MFKNIHFVGIKGVGMTALAVMAKEAGVMVTGSDLGDQFITDLTLEQAGIIPFDGFSAEHVNEAELVVTTGAHGGYENPEVVSAKEKGMRVVSMAEAVGMCMDGELFGRKFKGISVAGTHGKTTTTAMIATVFQACGQDPSYFIGTSHIPSLGRSGHYGKGDYFIVEADEYATEPVYDKRAKFLWQHPQIAVFTNIELDHTDIYPTIDDMREAFLTFAKQLSSDAVVVAFGDDHEVQRLKNSFSGRMVTYGFNDQNDFVLKRVHTTSERTFFHASGFGTDLGEFVLAVPGEHNALNALATTVVGLEAGLSLDQIKQALPTFHGSKRRMEKIGELESGAILYDDYAHHPTEIKKTLAALRSMYPQHQIVCIFQPHTYSRTKSLFQEFAHAFTVADTVVLTNIYASMREADNPSVSSFLLSEEINKYHKDVVFLPELDDVVKYLNEKGYKENTIVLTMGAGDIYKISERITNF